MIYLIGSDQKIAPNKPPITAPTGPPKAAPTLAIPAAVPNFPPASELSYSSRYLLLCSS